MSKIRSSNVTIGISKAYVSSLDGDVLSLAQLECSMKDFSWDFGTAEEIDTTPICEKEARRTEYSLRGKGSMTFDVFLEPDSDGIKSLRESNTDLRTRLIVVEYKDDADKVIETRKVLGTVESISENAAVGDYVNWSITIGTSGRVAITEGEE